MQRNWSVVLIEPNNQKETGLKRARSNGAGRAEDLARHTLLLLE